MSDFVNRPSISYDAAARVVAAAVAVARASELAVNIAVCDPAGHLIAFASLDGSPFLSATIAQDKAYTVAAFNGLPSSEWPGILGGDLGLQLGLPQRPRFVPFGGGVPIAIDGVIVGAIGVSGASEADDIACALAGAAAV